jgi:HEAT repeat protein
VLTQALTERESHVGAQAAEALGRIGDRRAIESLKAALQSDKWQLQEAAEKALKQLG